MARMRVIKPARLKIGAVRLEALNAMRKVGTQIRGDFSKTTDTWEHKPKFEQSVSLKAPGPTMEVWTEDEIYGYVNDGTRAHVIRARNAPTLKFKTGFYPKTFPGVIGSVAGGSFGPWTGPREVMHPGTEPRQFGKALATKWQPIFFDRMTFAIRKAAKASGHAA